MAGTSRWVKTDGEIKYVCSSYFDVNFREGASDPYPNWFSSNNDDRMGTWNINKKVLAI